MYDSSLPGIAAPAEQDEQRPGRVVTGRLVIGRLGAVARGAAAKDLLMTAGSRSAQMAIGLVGNIVSARALGPADFGRFGVLMAVVTICGTLADAGLTYACIRLIARDSREDMARARVAARIYFLLRLMTGSITSLLGFALSEPIAAYLLGNPGLTPYLQLAFAILFGLAISSYPGTVLTGLALFGRSAVAGLLNSAITVAGILAIFFSGQLNLGTLVAWNVLLPLASTLPAWWLLPRGWLPWSRSSARLDAKVWREVAGEMVRFGRWMGVSLLASILVAQGDILLLGRLSSPAAVGAYSVALALAMRLDLLNQSLFTVMMPRASRLRGAAEMRRFVKGVLAGSGALAVGLIALALLARPFIMLAYGRSYAQAADLFLLLLVVVLIDLTTSSLGLLAFPLNRPRTLALAEWLRVIVLVGAGWLLIPGMQAAGAALARIACKVAGSTASLWTLLPAAGRVAEEQEQAVTAP